MVVVVAADVAINPVVSNALAGDLQSKRCQARVSATNDNDTNNQTNDIRYERKAFLAEQFLHINADHSLKWLLLVSFDCVAQFASEKVPTVPYLNPTPSDWRNDTIESTQHKSDTCDSLMFCVLTA